MLKESNSVFLSKLKSPLKKGMQLNITFQDNEVSTEMNNILDQRSGLMDSTLIKGRFQV